MEIKDCKITDYSSLFTRLLIRIIYVYLLLLMSLKQYEIPQKFSVLLYDNFMNASKHYISILIVIIISKKIMQLSKVINHKICDIINAIFHLVLLFRSLYGFYMYYVYFYVYKMFWNNEVNSFLLYFIILMPFI